MVATLARRPLRPIGGGDETVDKLADRVLARIGQRGFLGQNHNGGPQLGAFYRDVPSSTPSVLHWAGPASLFGALGLERQVISTRVTSFGLAERLPVQMTNVEWPQFAYFTGFVAGSGAEPEGPCDDPPTPGPGATCIQTAQFGRFSRQTRVLDISNTGREINRAEMRDLSLLNGPFVGGPGGITTPPSLGDGFNIYNEGFMRMTELIPDFQEWFGRMVYEGNPANNTAGGGYKEFPGLDILINTGHTDAVTGNTCPTLDSLLLNFGYQNVSTNNDAMTRLINDMTLVLRFLNNKAAAQRMAPVQFAIVMRENLFYEISAAWPCNYATYRCAIADDTTGNARVTVDGMDMAQMRDAMRQGQYLVMDGVRHPVIFDNALREDSNTNNANVSNGSFASDIYIVPLSVRGGLSVLYWEVFDFSRAMEAARAMMGGAAGTFYYTDGGRYLWHVKPPNNFCIQVLGLIKPRLIFRTPHLAARFTNVQYQTVLHEPDPFLDDPYFQRGGVSAGYAAPTFQVNLGGWTSVS